MNQRDKGNNPLKKCILQSNIGEIEISKFLDAWRVPLLLVRHMITLYLSSVSVQLVFASSFLKICILNIRNKYYFF